MLYIGTSGFSSTPQELGEWLSRIKELESVTEKTFVSANNHWQGQSVNTIRQLRVMLD